MEKESLIHYLSEQLQKIDLDGFDLDTWKTATTKVIDNFFGAGNEFSKSISRLDYVEKVSYEQLYPKKVRDASASVSKFKSAIRETIDQIRASDFSSKGEEKDEITRNILKTLKFHLRGSQLEDIKKASLLNELQKRKDNLLTIVEKMDSETLHRILRDILSENPIGGRL